MIQFFTAFKKTPIHPRLEMQLAWLKTQQIDTRVHFDVSIKKSTYLLNYFCFKLFRFELINAYKRQIESATQVIHIYDLKLLPLAIYAKKKGKKVVYETLDDNVFLHFYELEKQLKLFKLINKPLIWFFVNLEKRLIRTYCDATIVNSPNLLKLSSEDIWLLPYASPFEQAVIQPFDSTKETVFMYVGKLNQTKGARDYRSLMEEFGLKLHFFGEAKDSYSKEWIEKDDNIVSYGNVNSSDLLIGIQKLSQMYNVIGLSIIHPLNKSYALQEANKDIDYMCLGIPFIGNDRKPTYEKIKAGAGVLVTDKQAINDLIVNKADCYTRIARKQEKLYSDQYSTTSFFKTLNEVYSKIGITIEE